MFFIKLSGEQQIYLLVSIWNDGVWQRIWIVSIFNKLKVLNQMLMKLFIVKTFLDLNIVEKGDFEHLGDSKPSIYKYGIFETFSHHNLEILDKWWRIYRQQWHWKMILHKLQLCWLKLYKKDKSKEKGITKVMSIKLHYDICKWSSPRICRDSVYINWDILTQYFHFLDLSMLWTKSLNLQKLNRTEDNHYLENWKSHWIVYYLDVCLQI